jgi:hypothetical protein
VQEENAILMREVAMASLSSLDDAAAPAGADGPTIHPEMLEDAPRSIPDTAAEFLSTANESALERYQTERRARGMGGDSDGAAPLDDSPRPGVLVQHLLVTGYARQCLVAWWSEVAPAHWVPFSHCLGITALTSLGMQGLMMSTSSSQSWRHATSGTDASVFCARALTVPPAAWMAIRQARMDLLPKLSVLQTRTLPISRAMQWHRRMKRTM